MIRLAAVWLFLAGPAAAVTCEDITFKDARFTTCQVNVGQEDLRLFLDDGAGEIFGSFDRVGEAHSGRLSFAMNAGMYHDDRSPVGLYIKDGREIAPIVTREGPGNFGLLPNGVFCIRETSADVIESLRFVAEETTCEYATQSGPMLVIDGALHPRFIDGGTSRKVRNGVGTTVDGSIAVFAISNEPVNFYDFASLFRDHLGVHQALFLDGSISRLYAPDLNRNDAGFQLGPIVGVID